MHDIKAIRDNAAEYDALWAKRGLSLLESTPNIPFADVPEGEDEDSNVDIHA